MECKRASHITCPGVQHSTAHRALCAVISDRSHCLRLLVLLSRSNNVLICA